jgi:hypothetical protein
MGRSDVEELRKLQESFIRLGHNIIKNLLLNGHVSIVGDWNALTNADWQKLEARAARIIRKSPGRQLSFERPVEMPAQYLELLNLLPRLMEALIGIPESTAFSRGRASAATGPAVEGLQVAAETMVRAAARRQEYLIERIGQKLISRITQFYTSDRIMQTIGDDGTVTDYVFKRSELVDADGRQVDELSEEQRRRFFANFTFKVTPLSSLPVNRVQRALLAQELFKLGVADDEEVLKQAEYPDWREVLRRTQEKRQRGLLPPVDELTRGRGARTGARGDRLRMGKA